MIIWTSIFNNFILHTYLKGRAGFFFCTRSKIDMLGLWTHVFTVFHLAVCFILKYSIGTTACFKCILKTCTVDTCLVHTRKRTCKHCARDIIIYYVHRRSRVDGNLFLLFFFLKITRSHSVSRVSWFLTDRNVCPATWRVFSESSLNINRFIRSKEPRSEQ